jgi:hypothetical protein
LALDGDAVVVDLREAEPMGLSTLAVIVRARELFGLWSRPFTVRHPSASAQRLISICGLKDLFRPEPAHGTAGTAPGPFLGVPTTRRAGRRPSRPAPGPARVGERAGQGIDLREAASRTVDLRAAQAARTA